MLMLLNLRCVFQDSTILLLSKVMPVRTLPFRTNAQLPITFFDTICKGCIQDFSSGRAIAAQSPLHPVASIKIRLFYSSSKLTASVADEFC